MTRCVNSCEMIGDSRVFDCVYLDEDSGREVPSFGVQLSYADGLLVSFPDVSLSRIRRRRECLSCQKRFTTYEIIESVPIVVVKKDRSREAFDRNKLLNGMLRACQKRPVSIEMLEAAVDDIEAQIQNSLDREVPASRIGEYAMKKLKDIDEVAYVRFASVYRQFKDINSFHEEINRLLDEEEKK